MYITAKRNGEWVVENSKGEIVAKPGSLSFCKALTMRWNASEHAADAEAAMFASGHVVCAVVR